MSAASKRMVPAAFPEILHSFTREVIREYPATAPKDTHEWIYRFAVAHFSKGNGSNAMQPAPVQKSKVQRPTSAAKPPSGSQKFLSADQLEFMIVSHFREADKDHSNSLNHREFLRVVKRFAAELQLPVADIRQLMSLADENDDGLISYSEFVPLAVGIIESIYAKSRFQAAHEIRAAEAEASSRAFLLHGMPPAELEEAIHKVFLRADTDGSGALSRHEFLAALRSSSLGFTRREINVMMSEADDNGDGVVSYAEFLPVCFNLLGEMLAKQIEYSQLPSGEAQIVDNLMAGFRSYDAENTGRVLISEAAAALRESDLGLSEMQMRVVLSAANANHSEGSVEYRDFAHAAAGVITAMRGIAGDAEQAARVVQLRASESSQVAGMDAHTFKAKLPEILASCDKDGNGFANVMDIIAVLQHELHLDFTQLNAIVNLACASSTWSRKTNSVSLASVIDGSFDVLLELQAIG